ncbi:MAG: 50S ribosomal protein L24 [Chloroflexi bacterium]|nr:50S ribosomal protein L24 [Chloroflexota bacterium]MDA1146907.1 50S ribosomal protein L24 [Chloroflexota bacterium]MQC82398.1 50S ribosomal protein L24 [Chloroflexota bacterium]MQC82960.1 50S ribosomal protein L24 [Chloroflexota bacterium]PKB56507.1 MAG: 50S ribosomal protein L24 [SAR202 cluster bacterium Casp-Chloro-G1]
MAAKIKRNDTVQVLHGRDRGRRGDVRGVSPTRGRAIVSGVNIVKRHRRGSSPQDPGGIIEMEAPIHASNLALVCTNCDRATRVGFRSLDDGRKVRFCKRCNEAID